MKDSILSLVAAAAFALTAGVISERAMDNRATRVPAAPTAVMDEGLHDAVAAPATVGLAGKPVPTSWFKTPEQNRAEIDSALLASRRGRTSGPDPRVALQ